VDTLLGDDSCNVLGICHVKGWIVGFDPFWSCTSAEAVADLGLCDF